MCKQGVSSSVEKACIGDPSIHPNSLSGLWRSVARSSCSQPGQDHIEERTLKP